MKTGLSEVMEVKGSAAGLVGTGLVFLPKYWYEAVLCEEALVKYIRQEGLSLIEFRDMDYSSSTAFDTPQPEGYSLARVFVQADLELAVFGQKLSLACKQAEKEIHTSTLKHRLSFSVGRLSTSGQNV